jgi:hypothetical protein
VVAVIDPYRTLGLDAVSFGLSALIVATGVRARPSPGRDPGARPSLWAVSADWIRIVFGNRKLLTLVLFGWLAGFYIVPEGLAAPYAHSLHGSTFTVGLLMAAMPGRAARVSSPPRRPSSRPSSPPPGHARSAWPSRVCTPSKGSASWPAAPRRRR